MDARYYIIDLVAREDDEYIWETTEEDFYQGVDENWHIAHDERDVVPKYRTMMREFKADADHEESFNAFSFLKLSTMSPQEWGY